MLTCAFVEAALQRREHLPTLDHLQGIPPRPMHWQQPDEMTRSTRTVQLYVRSAGGPYVPMATYGSSRHDLASHSLYIRLVPSALSRPWGSLAPEASQSVVHVMFELQPYVPTPRSADTLASNPARSLQSESTRNCPLDHSCAPLLEIAGLGTRPRSAEQRCTHNPHAMRVHEGPWHAAQLLVSLRGGGKPQGPHLRGADSVGALSYSCH